MEAYAKLKKYRQSARKMRLVANLVRGLEVSEAFYQLKYLSKKAALPLEKLLKSAVANWHQGRKEGELPSAKEPMRISAIWVDQATPLKRIKPRAQGRANYIWKHGCHVTLVVQQPLETTINKEQERQPTPLPVMLAKEEEPTSLPVTSAAK